MTDVQIAPRVENTATDTESIVSGGWFRIRPSKAYVAGGQWVLPVWPSSVTPLQGAVVTVKLDPLPSVPYELEIEIPDGNGGKFKLNEFRIVPSSGTAVKWEDLELVNAPGSSGGGGGGSNSELAARVAALESAIAGLSGGASTLAGISDMSAFMRTVNDDTSASAARTTLGAAASAAPTLTGTTTVADLTASGGVSVAGTLTASGTVSIPNAALAIAKVSGLQTALDGKLPSTDLAATPILLGTTTSTYPARPATTRPVWFVNPNVQPTNDGSTSGGGGMVPDGTLPNGLMDAWIS